MAANYTDRETVKRHLGINDAMDDDLIDKAIAAASRAIDRWTGTTFYPVTETRTFTSGADGVVWVDRFVDTAGLVVSTGSGGVFSRTLTSSQYVLGPDNAAGRGLAYDRISAPYGPGFAGGGYPDVQVTATWGYSTVPDDVEFACRLKASRLFRRGDSPEGAAGTGEYGEVRISNLEDGDVVLLLMPFRDLGWA